MTRSRDIADQQENLGGAVAPFVAGKNKIINGDFGIWQRGTSFTVGATNTYTADRWQTNRNGSGATITVSQQTFTTGAAPVAGYEGQNFIRIAQSVAGTGGSFNILQQRIENVRTFAGQTVTISFWAKADTTRTISVNLEQEFGSGGSSAVYTTLNAGIALTTSWARYTVTGVVPSISGKTVGTGSFLGPYFGFDVNTTQTFDIWGVQAEAGNVATPFTTASGSIGGELALCQRYYEQQQLLSIIGHAYNTTSFSYNLPYKVTKRTTPTITFLATGNYSLYCGTTSTRTVASVGPNLVDTQQLQFLASISGSTVTAGFASHFDCANSAAIVINAEL